MGSVFPDSHAILGDDGFKFDVFSDDFDSALRRAVFIVPPILFQSADNADAAAFCQCTAAGLRRRRPRLNIEVRDFLLQFIVLFEESVCRYGKKAHGGAVRGGSKNRIFDQIAFDQNRI